VNLGTRCAAISTITARYRNQTRDRPAIATAESVRDANMHLEALGVSSARVTAALQCGLKRLGAA
jgi:hypothetical protein